MKKASVDRAGADPPRVVNVTSAGADPPRVASVVAAVDNKAIGRVEAKDERPKVPYLLRQDSQPRANTSVVAALKRAATRLHSRMLKSNNMDGIATKKR